MDRRQALRTLHLDEAADGRTIESAYWALVRRAQRRADTDRDAHVEIDELNEAYDALAPANQRRRHAAEGAPAAGVSGLPILDAVVDWIAAEALRTRVRWAGRNPEIALIGGAALGLMAIALGAGASLTATFVATALLFVAIWSPWRRVH